MERKVRFIPYRDIHGREIVLTESDTDDVLKQVTAKLILCPETQGLRSIKWCVGCEFSNGHITTGQLCKSGKEYEHPEWYSIHKIKTINIVIR